MIPRNAIVEIIEEQGGLEKLKEVGHFKIVNSPYMDLNIDYIGKGPNGHPMIAIAHNYIQNGDVMADPDMQVEIYCDLLFPVTYQQDSLGIFQEVYETDEKGKAVGVRPKLKTQLKSFLEKWCSNLRKQGFIEAASVDQNELIKDSLQDALGVTVEVL